MYPRKDTKKAKCTHELDEKKEGTKSPNAIKKKKHPVNLNLAPFSFPGKHIYKVRFLVKLKTMTTEEGCCDDLARLRSCGFGQCCAETAKHGKKPQEQTTKTQKQKLLPAAGCCQQSEP